MYPGRRKSFPHVAETGHHILKGAQHDENSASVLGVYRVLGSSEKEATYLTRFLVRRRNDRADGTELEILE